MMINRFSRALATGLLVMLGLTACRTTPKPPPSALLPAESYPAIGSIERLDPRLDALIPQARPSKNSRKGSIGRKARFGSRITSFSPMYRATRSIDGKKGARRWNS